MSVGSVLSNPYAMPWLQAGGVTGAGPGPAGSMPQPPPPANGSAPTAAGGTSGSLFDMLSSAIQAALLQVQSEQGATGTTASTATAPPASSTLDTLLKDIAAAIQTNATGSAATHGAASPQTAAVTARDSDGDSATASPGTTQTTANGLPAPLSQMVNAMALATMKALQAYSSAQQSGAVGAGTVTTA